MDANPSAKRGGDSKAAQTPPKRGDPAAAEQEQQTRRGGSSWQPETPQELGAGQEQPLGKGAGGSGPCLALQGWGHAEGSGADVSRLFDQKGL